MTAPRYIPARNGLSRRSFLAASAAALAAGCNGSRSTPVGPGGLEKMIVLGVDGMDPGLLQRFVAEGRLPNLRRLMEMGSFTPLATSNPAQSPVAWSNFIAGTNPGGHGIFDFIARDPVTMKPYHSTARLQPGGSALRLGRLVIPTSSGKISSLRRGPTFWNDLEQHGIDCTVFRMPANFPPTEGEATTLSGMGTPDLQGGYGTFTWFTDDGAARSRDVPGGRIEQVTVREHVVAGVLRGPPNEFSTEPEPAELPITVYRDPERAVVKIVIQETSLVLREGEWSEWVAVRFTLIPHAATVSGICRMYLKSAREPFGLYVSPINIDPADPSVPLSTPPDYSRRLVRELGYFYTQGIVEDTQALRAGVLDTEEYQQQALFVHEERMRFFAHELGRFRKGFLFFYFSTLDQNSHVFWHAIDPQHPLYSRELAERHGDFIAALYQKVDTAVGQALERLDERSWLMVLSDHGFTSFRRQFNLNSWLLDHGYIRTLRPPLRDGSTLFQDVDWKRTRAYGVGLNGLYLNRQGRESQGTVRTDLDADRLLRELATRLENFRDPDSGEQVILKVALARDEYSGPLAAAGPDLLVGYNRGYRASWDTILGGFPRQHVLDNTDAWSGDHCVDPAVVPGVLLSSRPLSKVAPRIEDLAPTILDAFGVPVPEGMTGRKLV